MNTEFAAAGANESAPQIPAAATIGTGRALITLMRRELWEHRALWIAPLVLAVLLVVCAVPGRIHLPEAGPDDAWWLARAFGLPQSVALFSILQWVLSVPLYLVACIVLSFYLLDCLFAERKDRSILFWKSLPVSDGLTVLSKTLVALVVVPLGVFALAAATGIAFTVIFSLKAAFGTMPAVLTWDTLEWLRTELTLLLMLVLAVLWYAPLAAYLLLVSAWARRMPFVWANLILLVPIVLEWFAFRSHAIFNLLAYRTAGIWQLLALGHSNIVSKHGLHPFGTLLGELNFRGAFTDIDLWLGLAAAAAMLFAAVRIRRYRDDT